MKNFPISITDSNELYGFSTRTSTVLDNRLSGDAFVSSYNKSLKEANSELASALGRNLGSDFTGLLFTGDVKRDDGFISLRDYTRSECHSADPARVEAALKVYEAVVNVGTTIYKLGYVDETAKLEALFSELDKPEMQAALQAIEATGRYETLKAAQLEFEATYKDKTITESEINYPLVKDSKIKIAKALNWLLSYVEANAELNTDGFVKAESEIDEIITDIVTIARARKTRDSNSKKKEEEIKKE